MQELMVLLVMSLLYLTKVIKSSVSSMGRRMPSLVKTYDMLALG